MYNPHEHEHELRAALKVFGYPAAEIIGPSLEEERARRAP